MAIGIFLKVQNLFHKPIVFKKLSPYLVIVIIFLQINQNVSALEFHEFRNSDPSERPNDTSQTGVNFMQQFEEQLLHSTIRKISSSSSLPYYSHLFLSVIRFLVRNVFTKGWTAQVAIRRLDNLKKNILNYYTTKVELEARDKGIGFPSLEGALLSLAFLTFSVILIDFIQTLLAKLRLKAATTTAAPAAAFLGRQFLPLPMQPTEAMSSGSLGSFKTMEDEVTTISSYVLSAIERPFFIIPSPSSVTWWRRLTKGIHRFFIPMIKS